MSQLPRGFIVALVLLAGVIVILVANPPHRSCTSKVEKLRELQEGNLFPSSAKSSVRTPKILSEVEKCKLGNTPGACFKLFTILRSLVRDLANFPLECSEDLLEVGEVRYSLKEGMEIMTQVAWGEVPPAEGEQLRMGWLEPSDVALYCHLRETYARVYGAESFQQIRGMILSKLPGEGAIWEKGQCVNCEFRKPAVQLLLPAEILKRSLFSIRCEAYR